MLIVQLNSQTDAELRASDVKVTLDGEAIGVLGPLTDTELRATPVDVLGPLTSAERTAQDPATSTLQGDIKDLIGALAGPAAGSVNKQLADFLVSLGNPSGSAVITDIDGTLQQYLRGLVKLWIAGLPAGSAIVGKFGIDQVTANANKVVDSAAEASLAKLVAPAKTPVIKSISAENTFSDPLAVDPEHYAVITISGISGDTVTLQQSYNSSAWEDIEEFTSDISAHAIPVLESNLRLRAGVKTGDYSAGTIAIRLSQG